MRVALDTNILVSAFATRGICTDILNLVLTEHQLTLGETVLEELSRVLRDKIKVPSQAVAETIVFLRAQAVVVGPSPKTGFVLRDKDDESVLDEAVAGLAEVLVTGDRDLLDVAASAPIKILDPRGFWEEIRSEASAED